MFRWRWVTERGYHTGQPSVLDNLDSHFPAEEELREGWTRWIPKVPYNSKAYVLMRLPAQRTLFLDIKFHDPWWNYSSAIFFCVCVTRQKMYYWFLIQPQTMRLRENSIEWGVREPRYSPLSHLRGKRVWAVWPWAIDFASLGFSLPRIRWQEWLSVLQFSSSSKSLNPSSSPQNLVHLQSSKKSGLIILY